MVTSVNQVRHLYVAKDYKALAEVGDIQVNGDGENIWFEYLGAGGKTRSDLIPIDNILYARGKYAQELRRPIKGVTVMLDPNVNGGAPVAGQEYLLRVAINQYGGMSDEDVTYKYGMVKATPNMTAEQFYYAMGESLRRNFGSEDFILAVGVNSTKVDLFENNQDWVLGTKSSEPVFFEVQPTTITFEGEEVIWGVTEDVASEIAGYEGNGKVIADLEYFCMGERGDIYRGMGFPNVIPTKYLVDPTKEYHTIDIHYAYVGSNEAVQKSEKTITIVSTDLDVMIDIEIGINAFANKNLLFKFTDYE